MAFYEGKRLKGGSFLLTFLTAAGKKVSRQQAKHEAKM